MSTFSLPASSTSLLTRYRVATIQFEPALSEKEQNVSRLLQLVEEAARQEARLIVLPEMATTGYCWESRTEITPHVEPIPGPTTDRFQMLATRYHCYIALSLPEVDPTTHVYYNSMALIGPTGILGTYRKIHSYISEPRWARDGDLGFPVWETPLGRLAGAICMDAMYCESTRIAALRGADVILFPTNWLEEKCPSSWWMARAFENGLYFIAANRYGVERGVQFSGGSCIIDPEGRIQSYLDNGEGIVYGEVDLARCRQKSWGGSTSMGDCLADRRPSAYMPLVHNTYLWEPLLYHGLYNLGELPPGQLSCVGIIQTDLQALNAEGCMTATSLCEMLRTILRDYDPTRPDVLVLPELLLPGPIGSSPSEAIARIQAGAIAVPGSETDALVALATEFQITLVLGVAERASNDSAPVYYNTVLLIDPEGIYGVYRKLHLTHTDRLWATPGNLGMPTFDTPTGRIGLLTGYDVLFPETLRVLAGQGVDLVCAPTFLDFPAPIGLHPSTIPFPKPYAPAEYDPTHFLIWRVRAAEHNVYLALANWSGQTAEPAGPHANGYSGIFSPVYSTYPWPEVIADEGELGLTMMTIDTREQRTGRRSSTTPLNYAPGQMLGSLTGELAYGIRDTIPGNAVRGKPMLRKRQPFWYLDLVRDLKQPIDP